MGKIYKDPQNQQIDYSAEKEIRSLMSKNGTSQLIRYIQYALENIAYQMQGENEYRAKKYLQAAETLEPAYETIKNEIGL
jgi:hypothetical protein